MWYLEISKINTASFIHMYSMYPGCARIVAHMYVSVCNITVGHWPYFTRSADMATHFLLCADILASQVGIIGKIYWASFLGSEEPSLKLLRSEELQCMNFSPISNCRRSKSAILFSRNIHKF